VYVRYLSTTLQSIAPSQGIGIQFGTGSLALPSISFIGDPNTGIYSPAADTIAFVEGGVEAMRIDSSANVGIGTSSPDGRLHVMTSSAGAVTADADADDLTIEGATNPGISILGTGDDVCSIYFGNPGSNGQKDGGIRYFQESFATVADRRSMTFITGTLERARIASDGPLRIAMQNYGSPPSSTNFGVSINNTSAGSRFYGQGAGTETQIEFGNTNGARGSIQTNATNTLYNTTSDYRLKEDVVPMTGALDIVSTLKPCTYKWKVNGSAGQGFIAHELQAVIPDAVTGEKDAVDDKGEPKYQMVDTSFLVATLTAAIQEQQAMIDTMKQEIAELKAKVGE
jgi:hypothetical protein